jgi:hypothetical protein
LRLNALQIEYYRKLLRRKTCKKKIEIYFTSQLLYCEGNDPRAQSFLLGLGTTAAIEA